MDGIRKTAGLLLCLAVFALTGGSSSAAEYLGDKECFACHKQVKQSYLNDRHGQVFTLNPRNDQEARGCEACHGPGAAHKVAADRADKGEKVPMDVQYSFRKGTESAAENNRLCLGCHEKGESAHWKGSVHEREDIGCVDCHVIHGDGPADGTETCVGCHEQKRAQMQRSSHVPLREGQITCAACHNPHGSTGPALLRQASHNENCYSCHTEKRGPVIWEHAPVRENCGNCHDPHGSNQGSLLTMRMPYLCESCHAMRHHPSTVYDGAKLTSTPPYPDKHLVGKGCLNCHPMVHGSNHPSGARNSR